VTQRSGTVTPVDRSRASRRDDLITALLSAWLLIGLFVDGWAHNNLDAIETFFTPWHTALYSGYAATAAWMGWLVLRGTRGGLPIRAAIPVGYGLGVVGAVGFGVAGVGDMIWHTVLGIEVSLEALFSPPHLALLTAGLLMATSPMRSVWSSGDPRAISLGRFLPPLLSLTLTTATVAFFLQYVSAFLSRYPTTPDAVSVTRLPGGYVTPETSQIIGILAVLVTNLILVAPVLLILHRWDPPFGSITLLFTTVAVLMASQHEFEVGITVLAALAGGLAADIVIARLRPTPSRQGPYRMVAVVVPAVLWTAYFTLLDVQFGVAWDTSVWSGAIALSVLSGLALSLVMAPPPAGAEHEA
jgi:hypothetical protein